MLRTNTSFNAVLAFAFSLLSFIALAQPANDACVNAQVITIPASGNICINSTNVGATSDLTTNACDTGVPGNEVWFTYIATGGANSVTVTPNGATPASAMVVSIQNQPCGSGVYNNCSSATGAAAATTSFAYTVGTQVYVCVETNGTNGTFQLCVTSVSQPAAPGNSCATATPICNKNTFTLATFPVNNNVITPSCFPTPFQRPMFYQFTAGVSGTCLWTVDPNGAAEYDWVMYNITAGCPGTEVCCNFNYAFGAGVPIGMANAPNGDCGSAGAEGNEFEFSPPASVIAGQTYLIVIDNYTDNNVGFTMSWGGTFDMAPVPSFTATPSTGCAPLNVNINNTSIASTSYSWNFGNGNTSAAAAPPVQTYSTPGTYLISLVATSASGCTDVASQSVIVNPGPSMTAPANITQCAGTTIAASNYSSTPAGATFTWTNSNTSIGLAASGSGNTPAFTATNATGNPITATITVTPTSGTCSGTPVSYTITVNPSPTMTDPPNISQCAGTSVAAVNFVSGTAGATFGWTNSNTAVGLGASGSGNTPSFTATNATANPITATVTVTPSFGVCTGTPQTYTITVNPTPTMSTPGNITQCAGTTVATSSYTSPTAGATFAWTNTNTGIGLGASGTGNTPSFTATNATSSPIIGTITVTPTSGTCIGTPVNYTITVYPTPVLTDPTDITECAGAPVAASNYVSTVVGTSFAWTNSNTSVGLGASGTGNTPAFTATNGTASPITGTVTVTPSFGTCNGTPQTYTITVNPNPTMTDPADITQCAQTNISASNFVSPTPGATFAWTNSDPSIGLAASGTGNTPAFTATNATSAAVTSTITVTPSSGTCVGTPQTYTITVNPIPAISPISDAFYCIGSTVPVTTPNVTPAVSATSWTNSNTNIGLAASGTGDVPTFTADNPGAGSISGTITVNASNAGCNAVPVTYVITVGMSPTADQETDITACTGDAIPSIVFTSTAPGTSFDWTNSVTTIGVAASGTGNIPAFSAVNNSTNPVTSTIDVTPYIGTCVGPVMTFTITVNPSPTANANSNSPICEGSALNLTSTGPAGSTYSWTGPNSFGSALQNPTIPAATIAAAGNYTVTVTSLGCSSTASVSVVVNPGAAPTINAAGPFCANDNPVNLTASVAGGTWTGPGITNGATGQFTPSNAAVGNNTITYTMSGGCSIPATTNIVINALPTVAFNSPDLVGCEPFSTSLVDLSSPASNSVVWDFGDGTTSTQTGAVNHTFNSVGCYTITLTSTTAAGCTATSSQTNYICVTPYADASFTVDNPTHSMLNPTFHTFNNSTDATTYSWNFGDGSNSTATNPVHTYGSDPGSYVITLVANNPGNCPDTARMTVVLLEELIYYVPNSFTPDGDEYNNTFQPVFTTGFDPQNFSLLIFNRWGELIFESKDATIGWDGTYHDELCKEGVYTWAIKFKSPSNDKKYEVQGHFTLIK